jgi:hypothetical protein
VNDIDDIAVAASRTISCRLLRQSNAVLVAEPQAFSSIAVNWRFLEAGNKRYVTQPGEPCTSSQLWQRQSSPGFSFSSLHRLAETTPILVAVEADSAQFVAFCLIGHHRTRFKHVLGSRGQCSSSRRHPTLVSFSVHSGETVASTSVIDNELRTTHLPQCSGFVWEKGSPRRS